MKNYMNMEKFTQKSLEAIQAAQSDALSRNNTQIEQQHMLYALLSQSDGLIPQMLIKMGVNVNAVLNEAKKSVDSLPYSSSSSQPYLSGDLNKVLEMSQKLAENMKDDYASVEHIFLSMLESPNSAVRTIFTNNGITKPAFLKELKNVRGNAELQAKIRKAHTTRFKNTATILLKEQEATSSILLSAVTMKYEM